MFQQILLIILYYLSFTFFQCLFFACICFCLMSLWLHLPRAPGVVMTTSVLLGWWSVSWLIYVVGRWTVYIHKSDRHKHAQPSLHHHIPASQPQHHISNNSWLPTSRQSLSASIRVCRVTTSTVCALYLYMDANFSGFFMPTNNSALMVFHFMGPCTNHTFWQPTSVAMQEARS